MPIIDLLLKEHPVRKSRAQKAAFRSWVMEQAQAMGYAAQVEQQGMHANLVIGDPETSQVIFTAHYDTPARMVVPNLIFPANIPMFLCVQLALVLGLLAISVAVGGTVGMLLHQPRAGYFVGLAVYWVILLLMLLGPANPSNANDNSSGVAAVLELMARIPQEQRAHAAFLLFDNEEKGLLGSSRNPSNANDNSSGVAAVLELMARIPQEQRAHAAFLLFDNEEKGLLGSSRYAKAHPEVRKGKLLINMDCVGDGEHVLFMANQATRAHALFPLLIQTMEEQPGRQFVLREMEKSVYPSDQRHFALGIAVCACQKSHRLGYYCSKIHTAKDTVCSQENMDYLAAGLTRFVAVIASAEKTAPAA